MKGSYCLIINVEKDTKIKIGKKLGIINFKKGCYVYVGSAMNSLESRVKRHLSDNKKKHWHIDYLRQEADVIAALPIRTADDLEHELAQAVGSVSDWSIKGFGCTDCMCSSHLFGFTENPIHYRPFIKVVEDFRMNRLASLMTDNALW